MRIFVHNRAKRQSPTFRSEAMMPAQSGDRTPHGNRAPLSRARRSTRVQFLNLGFVAGVWGVHVPSVKAQFALDERTLAVVMLAMTVGSLATLFVAGRIVGAIGARNTARAAGIGFCCALGLTLVMPGFWALLPIMILLGACESTFDVAINAEGTTLERLSGRAIVSGFHGMFSVGAMCGAGTAALMLRAHLPAWLQLAAVGSVVSCSVIYASRGMLDAHPAPQTAQAHFTWPSGTLLRIGMLICLGMLAEGVMYNWSVLYVTQELHTPQATGALCYVAFSAATAATRFAGDSVRARVSERKMLLAGPSLAAVAMLGVLLLARPWIAMAGFALVGVGLATVVPILYNAATRIPGVSPAAAIASASSIGYVGFMIGPPIIGAIAHVTTLTVAMGTLIVASLMLVIGSRRVPEPVSTVDVQRVTSGTLAPQQAGN